MKVNIIMPYNIPVCNDKAAVKAMILANYAEYIGNLSVSTVLAELHMKA